MKKFAVKALIVLAVVIALCMFFSGTIRTITTAKVRFTSAKSGKLEINIPLKGKIEFKNTEELTLPLDEKQSVNVKKLYVGEGDYVEEGDKLISVQLSGFDEEIDKLKTEYDSAADSLRELKRKNGEIKLSRSEKAWLDAYNTAQVAASELRTKRIDVRMLLAKKGLEMPEEGFDGKNYPEEADEDLIAAIDELIEAQTASDTAEEELSKLNRYALSDTVWEQLKQQQEYENKMQEAETGILELTMQKQSLSSIKAPHSGYIAKVNVAKGDACGEDTVVLLITKEDEEPVIRADISEVKQTVTEGAKVNVETNWYGRCESVVTNTGIAKDGSKYADIELTKDIIEANGSVASMLENELQLYLTSKAKESTYLISATAVRGSGDERYVLIAQREGSTFGGTQMKAKKQTITVLGESNSTVSINEDLSRASVIYMEDRQVNEGDAVMEYTE